MKMNFRYFLLGTLLLLAAGCLRTRGDVKEVDQRQVMQEQVSTLQVRNADSSARVSELQESLREVSGRVLNLETRMEQILRSESSQASAAIEQNQALKRQIELMQQEMGQLQTSVLGLQQELATLKSQPVQSSSTTKSGSSSKGSKDAIYKEAEGHFNSKDWKRAIVTYQKFREESPRNSKVPEAIYKIGVSFQELGLKDEARAFFDEAIGKYPESEGARKAKLRLRTLR